MPPTHTEEGLEAAREIRARHPQTAIVILSQHVEVGIAMRVLVENPERLGYLLKDRVTDIERLRGARCATSRPAARRSTRRSSRSCSRATATTARSRRSPRASARCSS